MTGQSGISDPALLVRVSFKIVDLLRAGLLSVRLLRSQNKSANWEKPNSRFYAGAGNKEVISGLGPLLKSELVFLLWAPLKD